MSYMYAIGYAIGLRWPYQVRPTNLFTTGLYEGHRDRKMGIA